MKSACALLMGAAAFAALTRAQEIAPPTLSTYVLAHGSASFQGEDGWTIHCDEGKTLTVLGAGTGSAKGSRLGMRECQPWTVGRHLLVWGKRNKRTHTILAEQIQVNERAFERISGLALIDKVLEPEHNGSATLRADGYVLHATTNTRLLKGDRAVLSLAAVTTNMWVRYVGKPHSDGSVLLTDMLVTPNVIVKKEGHIRSESEFDAQAVTEQERQGKMNKFFLGLNAKRIPIHDDPVMQVRLQRVGESLLPAYQTALPVTDPTRIAFSFHLVDLQDGPDAVALPSGIILVPFQVVQLLNDTQLAAVLAANIAEVMQKQAFRNLPMAHTLTALNLAGIAAGAVVPGLGLVTGLGTGLKQDAMQKAIHEQDLRQGMTLLKDAGYDLTQAPLAWWLIHSNPKKAALPNGTMPADADYCYQLLGTVWRDTLQQETTASATAPSGTAQ